MVTMTGRLLSRSVRRVGWGWVVKLTSGQYHHLSQRPLQKPTVVMDVNTQCVHIHQFSNISIESVHHHPLILLYWPSRFKRWPVKTQWPSPFNDSVFKSEPKWAKVSSWKLVLLTFTLSPYSWQAARETFSVKVCFLVFSAHVRRARVSHLCLFVTMFTSKLACVILVACV